MQRSNTITIMIKRIYFYKIATVKKKLTHANINNPYLKYIRPVKDIKIIDTWA